MADDQSQVPGSATPQGEGQTQEQFKAEMSRKFGNLEETLKQQNDLIRSIASTRQQQSSTTPETTEDEIDDNLAITNPKKFAEIVKKQAKAEIAREQQQTRSYEDRRNQVAQSIANDYPEALDQNSSLYKKADEIYKTFSAEEQRSPIAMKAAFRDAAAELDIKPKSKRQSGGDADGFSFGNSGGSSQMRRPKEEVSADTMELLSRFGLDTSNPKIQEMAKEKSKRQNWGRYEPVSPGKK